MELLELMAVLNRTTVEHQRSVRMYTTVAQNLGTKDFIGQFIHR